MVEVGISEHVSKDKLRPFTGDPLLELYLEPRGLRISTKKEAHELKGYVTYLLEAGHGVDDWNGYPLMRDIFQNGKEAKWQASLGSEESIRKLLISAVDVLFGQYVKQESPLMTLSQEIHNWIRADTYKSEKPEIDCQLPTLVTKSLLDRGGVENVIVMEMSPYKPHPYLLITDERFPHYMIHFPAEGGDVQEKSGNQIENNVGSRSRRVVLKNSIDAMRFMDYGTVALKILAEFRNSPHGGRRQGFFMDRANDIYEAMEKEFGDIKGFDLMAYFEQIWQYALKD